MPFARLRRPGAALAFLTDSRFLRLCPRLVVAAATLISAACSNDTSTEAGPGAGPAFTTTSVDCANGCKDTFTDGDGTPLTAHAPDADGFTWDLVEGFSNYSAEIRSNAVGVEDAATLDGTFVYLIPETFADDSAEIEVEVFGAPMPLAGHYSAWITLRGDGTIDPFLGGYHVWMETAGGRTYVGVQRNGEQLPLDAPGIEVPHPGLGVHKLTAVLRGGILTAYWNGVLVKSVSDPSPLPPGHPGFGHMTNISSPTTDESQESQVRVTSFEVWSAPSVRIEAANGSMEVRPERTTGSAPLDLKIGVYNAQGEPQPNRTVTLTLTPTELSAGHDHEDGKPAGTLSHQNPVPTGPYGEVIVKYTAPPPSGPVTIRGASSGAQEASETINVGVPELVPIAINGEHHGFQSSNLHASNDFYMAPGALDVMTQIWRRYVEKGDPISPSKKFTITAATLVSGGLYDYRGTWAPPHSTHRQGGDMDFDDAVAEASPQFMEQVCSKFKFGGLKVVCELHNGNHIHAYLGPNR